MGLRFDNCGQLAVVLLEQLEDTQGLGVMDIMARGTELRRGSAMLRLNPGGDVFVVAFQVGSIVRIGEVKGSAGGGMSLEVLGLTCVVSEFLVDPYDCERARLHGHPARVLRNRLVVALRVS